MTHTKDIKQVEAVVVSLPEDIVSKYNKQFQELKAARTTPASEGAK